MSYRHGLALSLLLVVGCERAQKFTALPTQPNFPSDKIVEPSTFPADGWLEESSRGDMPIKFIAEHADDKKHPDHDLWEKLPRFWNEFPTAIYVMPPLNPWEVTVTLSSQLYGPVLHLIKVPRGLPDPTPYLPAANPPTYNKWVLGKKLFFDDKLLAVSAAQPRSCATCHDPKQGFTLHKKNVAESAPKGAVESPRNVPSLINCVYNRHQFWDGRATSLEEVLMQQLEDEQPPAKDATLERSPGYRHVWPGLVGRLNSRPDYIDAFKRTFGTRPTADNAAKALATYLRTILSGNALYDQAVHHMRKRQETQKLATVALEAEDFMAALPEAKRKDSSQLTSSLAKGHLEFQSARCAKCHPAPLFTDGGFHNISAGASARSSSSKEPGRFATLPYGLKDKQQIGAFKTPTLRNLSETPPYMHDGSLGSVKTVLEHYRSGIAQQLDNAYLDPLLSDLINTDRNRLLDDNGAKMLEDFLGSLQGEAVDAKVREPFPPPK